MLLGDRRAVTDRLLADGFGTDLRAGLRVEGVGCTGKGHICPGLRRLLPQFGSDVGPVQWGKEGRGGAKAVGTGGTALAQHGDLHAAKTGEHDAAVRAVGVEERVGTGGAAVHASLRLQRGKPERLAHGLPPGIEDERLNHVHIGSCGHLKRE